MKAQKEFDFLSMFGEPGEGSTDTHDDNVEEPNTDENNPASNPEDKKDEPNKNDNQEPYKLFQTEEEFNNHSKGIRENAKRDVYKELGIKDKSEFDAMKSTHGSEVETLNKTISDLKVTNTLLGAGIPSKDMDYAMVDLQKAKVDVNDSEALTKFASESKWIQKAEDAKANQAGQVVRRYEGDSLAAQRKRLMFGDLKEKR